MPERIDGIRRLFSVETIGRLDEMVVLLVRIQRGEPVPGVRATLVRHAHTISGAAGMFGVTDLERISRAAEQRLELLEPEDIPDPALTDALLHMASAMRATLHACRGMS